jgi:uncharacterized membrane protein YphA (DoxX/SURF4 family)
MESMDAVERSFAALVVLGFFTLIASIVAMALT